MFWMSGLVQRLEPPEQLQMEEGTDTEEDECQACSRRPLSLLISDVMCFEALSSPGPKISAKTVATP
jgi:hypothetical protein